MPVPASRISGASQPSSLPRPSAVFRPSSATRSSSASRTSSVRRPTYELRDTNGRPSSGGLRRYGSDTHLNTPSRFTVSTPLGRSPAVRHSVMPPDSSRKSKHENVLKVQEILQRDDNFYADLNLKNGLKSMTTNQFYAIINHFVRLISGKELDAFIRNGEIIDGIMNFMSQIEYPYSINKSMLKTPNAPHTFDNVVLMLLWLGNASNVKYIASDIAFIENYLHKHDEVFPSEEYTAMFSTAIQEGYRLWNNESDEHSTFIDRLTDGLISAKLNYKVSSAAELNALTENLKKKSKELADNPVKLNNVHEFEELESKYTEYETMEHDLIGQIKEKRDRLAAVRVNWNDKRTKVQHKQGKMNALACEIQNQKHTIGDYKKLQQDIMLLKSAIATITAEMKLIRDEESNHHIARARLLKKVSEAITAINNRAMQIVKIINKTHSRVSERDIDRLHLPPNPSLKQVHEMEQMLSHISSLVTVQKHKAQIELDKSAGQLSILKAKTESLQREYDGIQKKYEKIASEYVVTEKKAAMKIKKYENCTRKLSQEVDAAKAKYEALKVQIDAAHEEKKQLERNNVKLMEDAEAQAMKIAEGKQKVNRHLDGLNKMLDQRLDGLNYPK